MSKILLTGGNGLLGSYLKIEADRPSRSEFDITNYLHLKNRSEKEYDLTLMCKGQKQTRLVVLRSMF